MPIDYNFKEELRLSLEEEIKMILTTHTVKEIMKLLVGVGIMTILQTNAYAAEVVDPDKGLFVRSSGDNLADPTDPNVRIKCELRYKGIPVGYQIGIDHHDGSFTFIFDSKIGYLKVTKMHPLVIFNPIDASIVSGLPELAPYAGNPAYMIMISSENLKKSDAISWEGTGIFGQSTAIEVRGAYLIKDFSRAEKCLGTHFYLITN